MELMQLLGRCSSEVGPKRATPLTPGATPLTPGVTPLTPGATPLTPRVYQNIQK